MRCRPTPVVPLCSADPWRLLSPAATIAALRLEDPIATATRESIPHDELAPARTTPAYAPARCALWIVAAYLALTLVPAFRAIAGAATATAFTAHLAGLAAAAWAGWVLGRPSRHARGGAAYTRATLTWFPLIAIPLLYAEIPTLIAGAGSAYHDAEVQRWELALFGGTSPAATLAPALTSALASLPALVVSEALHAGYLSFYPIIYAPLVVVALRGDADALARGVTALVAVFAASYLAFVWFPVQGPRYLWAAPPGIPPGFFRALASSILESGSSRGTAFPSAHVAIAVTQSLFALRYHRPLGIIVAVLTALLTVGAIYGGYHYAVDAIAGALVGLLAGGLLRRWMVRSRTAGSEHLF